MKKSKTAQFDSLLKTPSSILLLMNLLAAGHVGAADAGEHCAAAGTGTRGKNAAILIAQADAGSASGITAEKIRAVVEINLRHNWQPIKGGPEESAAMIEFAIGANGQIEGVALRSSAGNNDFDQSAMEAIRKISQMPALPPSLGVSKLPFGATFHAGKEPWLELKLLAGAPPSTVSSSAAMPPQGMQAPPQGMQAPPQGMQAPPQGMQAPPQGMQAPPQGMQAPPQGMQAPPLGLQAQPTGMQGLQASKVQAGQQAKPIGVQPKAQASATKPGDVKGAAKLPPKAGQKTSTGKPANGQQPPAPQISEQPLAVPDTSNSQDINRRVLDLNNLAVVAINDSNYESAIAKLEEALKLDPTYKAARENLAIALNNYGMQLTNRPYDALVVFHKAVALDPDNPKTRTNLDTIIQYMGKSPKSFKDRLELGDKSVARGDLVGGRIEYEAALAIKPDQIAHQKLMQLMGGPPPGMAPPGQPGRPPGPQGAPAKSPGKVPATAGGSKPAAGKPTPGTAGSGGPASLDTMYRNIKVLETKTFGKTFESDDILTRLSRLESKLMGKPQTGKPMRRLDALLLLQ